MAYLKDTLAVPVLAGATAYFGTKMLGDTGTADLPLIGFSDASIAMGATVAGTSLLSQFSKNYIAPYVSSYGPNVVMAIEPVVTGGAAVALFKWGPFNNSVLDNNGWMKIFGVGAVSQVAGQYAKDAILGSNIST